MNQTVKSQNEATTHCRRLVRTLRPFDRIFNFEGTGLVEDGQTEEGHMKWKFALAYRRFVSRTDVEYVLNVSEANDVNDWEVRVLRHVLECLDKGYSNWAEMFRLKSQANALGKLQRAWRTVELTNRRAVHRAELDVFQFPDSILALFRPDVEQATNLCFVVKIKGRTMRHYATKAEAEAYVDGFTAAMKHRSRVEATVESA